MDTPWQPVFYGAITVSERGQIVLPAKAREDLGISRGDKLMVMGGPMGGLMIMRADALMADLARMRGMVDLLSKTVAQHEEDAPKSEGGRK